MLEETVYATTFGIISGAVVRFGNHNSHLDIWVEVGRNYTSYGTALAAEFLGTMTAAICLIQAEALRFENHALPGDSASSGGR